MRQRGFFLVELLIVTFLIMLFLFLGGKGKIESLIKAKETEATVQQQTKTVQDAVNQINQTNLNTVKYIDEAKSVQNTINNQSR